MYKLTKEQKIENLQEVRSSYLKKIETLQKMIKDIDSKIQKIQNSPSNTVPQQ